MKSGPLCALLRRILTWCSRKQVTHSRPAECHSNKLSSLGQTIQTEWSLLPEVFQAICTRRHQTQVDLFATRFNNKLPQLVSPVLDLSMGSGCIQSAMGGSGSIYLPTSSHLWLEVAGLPVYSDSPRVAQHVLVLGPSLPCLPNPFSQESAKPELPCPNPRTLATKEQGFFGTLLPEVEAPQGLNQISL